jgi:5,10-methylenetetrahydrofolate reductase
MVAADPAPAGNNPTNPYAFPPADKSRPNWSLEFFPPLTEAGTLNLHDRIERMCALGPAAVSVTWGAGGSTSDRSLALLEFVASLKEHGAGENEGVLHLTCTNMNRSKVVEALDVSHAVCSLEAKSDSVDVATLY